MPSSRSSTRRPRLSSLGGRSALLRSRSRLLLLPLLFLGFFLSFFEVLSFLPLFLRSRSSPLLLRGHGKTNTATRTVCAHTCVRPSIERLRVAFSTFGSGRGGRLPCGHEHSLKAPNDERREHTWSCVGSQKASRCTQIRQRGTTLPCTTPRKYAMYSSTRRDMATLVELHPSRHTPPHPVTTTATTPLLLLQRSLTPLRLFHPAPNAFRSPRVRPRRLQRVPTYLRQCHDWSSDSDSSSPRGRSAPLCRYRRPFPAGGG